MKLTQQQLESLLQNPVLDYKGKNIYAVCPWCGESEFGISLDNNHVFNCFRKKQCGVTGNIYTLLKKLDKIHDFLTTKEVNVFDKLHSSLYKDEKIYDLDLPEIQPPVLWKRVKEDSYFRSRGFEDYQFEKFEVGRSIIKKGYVTFLVRMNGKIVGYITRSEKSKEWIDNYNKKQKEQGSNLVYLRYNNSSSDFGKMLFGYDEIIPNVTTDVILVEGIFSKTKTDVNLGLDYADDLKCCCTFGAKLSEEQIELLRIKGVKRLIFWFEADVLNTIKDILSKASSHFIIKACYLQGYDPNNIDAKQACQLLASAVDWVEFNMSYVKTRLK